MAIQPISLSEFGQRLGDAADDTALLRRLYSHYCDLLRWNQRLSLVAQGDVEVLVERHFQESLAALPLVGGQVRSFMDIGSGGGFPGLVLAAALPGLEVTLVESRGRKWAFLKRAAARAGIRANCVCARIHRTLPAGLPGRVDCITIRAVRLEMPVWQALTERLSPTGRVVAWAGREAPKLPAALAGIAEVPLAGSHRRLICFERRS